MTWFDLKSYQRTPAGVCLDDKTFSFLAKDEKQARDIAYRRVREFPARFYGVLYDDKGAQLWSGDSPDA